MIIETVVEIVRHTPGWVGLLLPALVALGLSLTRQRDCSIARLTVLPLVLLVLSQGVSWLPRTRRVRVPGSWLPLALIVNLFAVKYVAGVMLSMQPRLAADLAFASTCSLAYGGFSGRFMARALALRSMPTARSHAGD